MNKTFTSTIENLQVFQPYNDIIAEKIISPLNQTHLEELTIKHVRQLQYLSHHRVQQQTHTTILYIIFSILLIIVIIYIIYKLKKKNNKKVNIQVTTDVPKYRFWPILKGEELRHVPTSMPSPNNVTSHIPTGSIHN